MMNNDRYAFCLYCDDVRQEVGGKMTLVGVYQGGIQINAPLPVTIPQLHIVCNIRTPIDRPFKSLAFRLMFGDEEVAASTIPDDFLEGLIHTSAPREESNSGIFNMQIGVQNILVTKPGKMVMLVTTEEGELRSNALEIRTQTET
jgi:hypothetical protein